MATYEDIAKSIKKRTLKSVYLIAGDEPLFIDQLAELFSRRLSLQTSKISTSPSSMVQMYLLGRSSSMLCASQ